MHGMSPLMSTTPAVDPSIELGARLDSFLSRLEEVDRHLKSVDSAARDFANVLEAIEVRVKVLESQAEAEGEEAVVMTAEEKDQKGKAQVRHEFIWLRTRGSPHITEIDSGNTLSVGWHRSTREIES